MTVDELIEELQRLPATAAVFIGDDYLDIDSLTYDKGIVIIHWGPSEEDDQSRLWAP
jgi:hypothetical protein